MGEAVSLGTNISRVESIAGSPGLDLISCFHGTYSIGGFGSPGDFADY